MIDHLPRECALQRELRGPAGEWGPNERLLAIIADAVRTGNWQRSRDQNAPRPKPVPRPEDVVATIHRHRELDAALLAQQARLARRNK